MPDPAARPGRRAAWPSAWRSRRPRSSRPRRQPPVDLAARFAQRVDAYEAADKATPPPAGAILLAGDSQFDRWKTFQEDLPGYTVINRGIDSFRTDDLIQYVDRLVIRYKPRMVVLHVGGNDIHRGKTPEQLLADTKTLVAKIRAGLPGVPIAWSSITPGPGRWERGAAAQGRQRLDQALDRDREGPVVHRPVGRDADHGRPAARGHLGRRPHPPEPRGLPDSRPAHDAGARPAGSRRWSMRQRRHRRRRRPERTSRSAAPAASRRAACRAS